MIKQLSQKENDLKDFFEFFKKSPNSAFGQNFLIDDKVLFDIAKASGAKKGDKILEIGPGLGFLTEELLNREAKVFAIEIEKTFFDYISKKFSKNKNFEVERADILSISNVEIKENLGNKQFKIVSNIPYQITGKIIKKFISSELPKPDECFLLVQKEVGERICATEGDMSLLSLSVRLYCEPRIVFEVKKDCFWPSPKVDSCLVAFENIQEQPLFEVEERNFWKIAKIGFSSPRKKLKNNLSAGFGARGEEIEALFEEIGLNKNARAEDLDVACWVRLSEKLK